MRRGNGRVKTKSDSARLAMKTVLDDFNPCRFRRIHRVSPFNGNPTSITTMYEMATATDVVWFAGTLQLNIFSVNLINTQKTADCLTSFVCVAFHRISVVQIRSERKEGRAGVVPKLGAILLKCVQKRP